ncbi:MAG: hypothetical protein OEV30_11630, partial [Ignavibacteria bacterium]|nr:hypothetical protein [Ignavibacteria bacterium]
TGLDFTAEQISMLPSERLPLFSEHAYDWTRRKNLIRFLAKVCTVRAKFSNLITDPDPATFHLLEDVNQHILAFERSRPEGGPRIVVVSNANCVDREQCMIRIDTERKAGTDLLSGKPVRISANHLRKVLKPGESLVLKL